MKKIWFLLGLMLLPLMAMANCETNPFLEVRAIQGTPYHEVGNPDAPLVMYEFFSLTCPSCAAFQTKHLPQILNDYVATGKMKLRMYDLVSDQVALIGSKVSRCISEDLYLKFTEFLMEEQENWAYSKAPLDELRKRAKIFGLSDQAFDACLDDRKMNATLLDAQKLVMKEAEITHTPTFIFVKKGEALDRGKKLQGFLEYKIYESVIQSYLGSDQK